MPKKIPDMQFETNLIRYEQVKVASLPPETREDRGSRETPATPARHCFSFRLGLERRTGI